MKNVILLFLLLGLYTSCSQDSDDQVNGTSEDWLIPSNEIRDGGPGKDGIPSVDDPNFVAPSESTLSGPELVVGIVYNDIIRAYPHEILDWHEIVNDELGDRKVALTYCPLTGTAIAWNREIDGKTTTFGVSGKLYNTNLIPYDRETDSYWSQIDLNCVNGSLIGTKAETFSVIETRWDTWKKMYPNTQVMNTQTGFSRNYGQYPYGGYRTNNNLIFPVNPRDDRLPLKERVLGVLNDGANRSYSINLFETPRVIYDQLGGDELIVVGSKEDNFIVAFFNQGFTDLEIDLTNLPVIATDNNGTELLIDGTIKTGNANTTQLNHPTSFIGYWFSFGAFYPGIEIYQ